MALDKIPLVTVGIQIYGFCMAPAPGVDGRISIYVRQSEHVYSDLNSSQVSHSKPPEEIWRGSPLPFDCTH